MTFKQFEAIAKKYRPDAVVSKHGEFWRNHETVTRLGIYFIDADGNPSKVYDYAGTYQEVLRKLGIETVTKEQIEIAETMLAKLKAEHGKTDPFFGLTIDNSESIKEYETKLKQYESAVKI